MDLVVDLSGRGDRAARIYDAMRGAILDGRLPEGERLPPTRELAAQLGVSRTTVTVAYELLAAEGFVAGRVGAGTVVICDRPGATVSGPAPSSVRPRAGWARPWPGFTTGGPTPAETRFDFSVGAPDQTLFPLAAWRRELLRAIDDVVVRAPGYGDPAGEPALRAAVARHLGVARGVRVTPQTVLITNGAQGALHLLGQVLVEPGMVVATEDSGYPPVREALAALGARVVPVPVDGEGIEVERLPQDARLVHVTPSHQAPTGVTLSLPRRVALLAWAARNDAVIVEDDYDSEFRFGSRPLEPLQALDQAGRVAYVGSFSKTMAPFLRLGYLVAPPTLMPALRTARLLADWHGEATTQVAMAGFIASGRLAWHLRRTRRVYADRHARVVAAVDGHLGPWLERVPSAAGLHLSATVRAGAGVDLTAVVERAAQAGVRVEPLSRYRVVAGREGLVIGYGRVDAARIEPGMAALAAAFRA